MPFRLVHHDLITVPLGHRRPGIFWLRLYHGDARHVAVVTEVPGNPSSSVTNAISQIAYYIESNFHVDTARLTFYEIWPSGSPQPISQQSIACSLGKRRLGRMRRATPSRS